MSTLTLVKLNQFLDALTAIAMSVVVAVVILRVVAGYTNLNFFGWTYVTIRRLADPLIGPVRRALMGFRADPKFAPLVTILIVLLFWYVLRVVTGSTLDTIAKVMEAVQQRVIARIVGQLLVALLQLYTLLIFMRIVFSWVNVSYANRMMRFLFKTTEPLLGPLRRAIPPVGRFDISACVAIIIVVVIEKAVQGTFLR